MSEEDMDLIAVTQINTGDGDGADITFEFNNKHISLSMFPSHTSSVEDHLISILTKVLSPDFADDNEDLVDEALDIILDVGRASFREMAPLHTPCTSLSTQILHSLLYPETFHFRLKTVDNKPTVVMIHPNEAYTIQSFGQDPEFESDFKIDPALPQYSSKEIQVLESLLSGGTVTRVLVDGKEMLCKARQDGLLDGNLERELSKLQQIANTDSSTIRIPKLIGYVKHAEDGHVIGLLREWIFSGDPDGGNGTLKQMCASPTEKKRRAKWAGQIRETVDQLHEMGLVWGDGKPSNIIIDKNDDVWLIDLAGGWTEGWVAEELADSVKGDEQAVGNIFKFLVVE